MRGIPEATVIILMAEERAEPSRAWRVRTKTDAPAAAAGADCVSLACGSAWQAERYGRAVGCYNQARRRQLAGALRPQKRLAGLDETGRAGRSSPKYTTATNKRILALLDQTPPEGYARWTGPAHRCLHQRPTTPTAAPFAWTKSRGPSKTPQTTFRASMISGY